MVQLDGLYEKSGYKAIVPYFRSKHDYEPKHIVWLGLICNVGTYLQIIKLVIIIVKCVYRTRLDGTRGSYRTYLKS